MITELLDSSEKEAAEKLRSLGFTEPAGVLRNLRLLSAGPFKERLGEILTHAALAPSPEGALNNIEAISSALPEGLVRNSLEKRETIERLVIVCGSSSYLSGILSQKPELYEWIFANGGLSEIKDFERFRDELGATADGMEDVDGLSRILREYKHREFLRIGTRDLLKIARMEETTRELSDLASASLDTAVAFAVESVKKSHGAPLCIDGDGATKEAELTVIGLGKLGGRELNFSSDIDIMYVYTSDEGESAGAEGKTSRISLHAFFTKAALIVNKLISNVTDRGFVFRVDLDLRPEGRSGAIVNSLASLEAYYESWGLSWERAAMIKARPVAGSFALGDAFMEMIKPFVYRRYMDFSVLEEIKSMKEKIDLSLLRRNPDAVDVKLGAGGIREIEFFCQALQLVHAGKDEGARERNTIEAIKKLQARGYMSNAEAVALTKSYVFLRNLEHRIQIVEGRQSQAIPARKEELERLARMMGFKDTEEKKAGEFFWKEYRSRTAAVHEIFRSLFYKSEEAEEEVPQDALLLLSPEMAGEEAVAKLSALGFRDAEAAYRNLKQLRGGPSFVQLGSRARVLFQRLAPVFLARIIASPDPDRALSYLERFISSVGARTAFYSLLNENRKVLDELVRLFGTSEFLSRTLVEQPGSLEQLLSRGLTTPYRGRRQIRDEFTAEIEGAAGYEEKLEALRRVKSQEVFRIGVNDIVGGVSHRQVSAQITFVAEAALAEALKIASEELARRYGVPEEGTFCILGLGKLGGSEMIYGSDLDILFVYSAPEDSVTGGERLISAHEFYVKLGQRIISVLTLRTQWGYVFDVDARLRPSGRPLVVSRPSLLEYHAAETSVWERQALTRARAVAGDIGFGSGVVKELGEILYSRPLADGDIEEMLRIRGRMEDEIAKETPTRYNIKAGKGGINDIEFLVQALQLKWGRTKRSIRTPHTSKALLRIFREGIIPQDDYRLLKDAYRFYRFLEQRQRIVHDRPEGDLIKDTQELAALARRAGYAGAGAGEELLSDYLGYAEKVRSIYLGTLKGLSREG